jgi:TusA-related sulfurtransferase
LESNAEIGPNKEGRGYFLDITGEVCPLTFVKAKLLLERMPEGAVAAILLKGEEPVANVPRSLAEDGHEVLSLAQEGPLYRLTVRKRR